MEEPELEYLVTILKVLSPSHFVVRKDYQDSSSSFDYFVYLENIIQTLYSKYDIQPEYPQLPAKGEIIIAKDERKGLWYRARVEALIETSKGTKISVYLVDYGDLITVRKEWVRTIQPNLLELPFQAIEFQLYGIQPLTLDVDDSDLHACLRVGETWDSSSVEFVAAKLLENVETKVRVKVVDVLEKQYGELFLFDGSKTISLNELLISEKHAIFTEDAVKNILPIPKAPIIPAPAPEARCRTTSESDSGVTIEQALHAQKDKRKEVISDLKSFAKRFIKTNDEGNAERALINGPKKVSLGRGFVPISPDQSLSDKTELSSNPTFGRSPLSQPKPASSPSKSDSDHFVSESTKSEFLDRQISKGVELDRHQSKENSLPLEVKTPPTLSQRELLKRALFKKQFATPESVQTSVPLSSNTPSCSRDQLYEQFVTPKPKLTPVSSKAAVQSTSNDPVSQQTGSVRPKEKLEKPLSTSLRKEISNQIVPSEAIKPTLSRLTFADYAAALTVSEPLSTSPRPVAAKKIHALEVSKRTSGDGPVKEFVKSPKTIAQFGDIAKRISKVPSKETVSEAKTLKVESVCSVGQTVAGLSKEIASNVETPKVENVSLKSKLLRKSLAHSAMTSKEIDSQQCAPVSSETSTLPNKASAELLCKLEPRPNVNVSMQNFSSPINDLNLSTQNEILIRYFSQNLLKSLHETPTLQQRSFSDLSSDTSLTLRDETSSSSVASVLPKKTSPTKTSNRSMLTQRLVASKSPTKVEPRQTVCDNAFNKSPTGKFQQVVASTCSLSSEASTKFCQQSLSTQSNDVLVARSSQKDTISSPKETDVLPQRAVSNSNKRFVPSSEKCTYSSDDSCNLNTSVQPKSTVTSPQSKKLKKLLGLKTAESFQETTQKRIASGYSSDDSQQGTSSIQPKVTPTSPQSEILKKLLEFKTPKSPKETTFMLQKSLPGFSSNKVSMSSSDEFCQQTAVVQPKDILITAKASTSPRSEAAKKLLAAKESKSPALSQKSGANSTSDKQSKTSSETSGSFGGLPMTNVPPKDTSPDNKRLSTSPRSTLVNRLIASRSITIQSQGIAADCNSRKLPVSGLQTWATDPDCPAIGTTDLSPQLLSNGRFRNNKSTGLESKSVKSGPEVAKPQKNPVEKPVSSFKNCSGKGNASTVGRLTADVETVTKVKSVVETQMGKAGVCCNKERLLPSIASLLDNRRSDEDDSFEPNLDTSFSSASVEDYNDQLETIYEQFCSTSGKEFFKIHEPDMLHEYMQGSNILKALSHGLHTPQPIFQREGAPFVSAIHQRLKELNFVRPTVIQAYMWPAVFRGRNAVVVSPPHSGKSLACILPLLSSVIEGVNYEDLRPGSGPLVLILSSSWKKCQTLYHQCLLLVPQDKNVRINVIYGGGTEKLKQVSLINGCDILISTPGCFLRILTEGCKKFTNLDRCCHLVLDDGDVLTDCYTNELKLILNEYAVAMRKRAKCSLPNQILLCCHRWTKGTESFVTNIMNEPVVYMTSFLEGAVYSRISIYPHFCTRTQQSQTLISLIENCPDHRKILVCTQVAESALFVFEFLRNASVYSLLAHEDMNHFLLQEVKQQWNNSPRSAVLVVTDPILYQLHLSDADILIHYDLPDFSKGRFSNRFLSLLDSLQPIPAMLKAGASFQNDSICHVLLNEECQRQASDLCKLFRRVGSQIPRPLLEASMVQQMKKPLCYNMKAFGSCRRQIWCPNRHFILAEQEQPQIKLSDCEVKLLVTYVVDASHYYARLLELYDPITKVKVSLKKSYLDVTIRLAMHYAQVFNRIVHENPRPGDLCGFQTKGGTFHRVVIEEVDAEKSTETWLQYRIRFLDEGWKDSAKAIQLLQLPLDLAKEEPLALEIFLCKVKPMDGDIEWTISSSTYVNDLIYRQELVGKVALCLGQTLWFNILVLRERLATSSAYVNVFTVGTKLVKNGFAVRNLNHVELLKKACEGKIVFPKPTKLQPSVSDQKVAPVAQSSTKITGSHTELVGSGPFKVFVSAVETPDLFFVQLADMDKSLTSLVDEIRSLIEENKLELVSDVVVGMLCIGQFNNDQWYRARVTSVSDKDVGLFFPDFGDTCTTQKGALYQMTEDLLKLPFQAIECSLEGVVPGHGGWSEAACDLLVDLTRESDNFYKELSLHVVNESNASVTRSRHYAVHLLHNSDSIAQMLITEGLTDFLSHLEANSPNSLEEVSSTSECEGSHAFEAHEFRSFLHLLGNDSKRCIQQPDSSDDEVPIVFPNRTVFAPSLADNLPQAIKPPLVSIDGVSRFPPITWWQTKKCLFVAIEVPSCQEYIINFSLKRLSFTENSSGKFYAVDMELYGEVNPDRCFSNSHGQSVDMGLPKIKSGFWPTLMATGKNRLVKYNFEHLCSLSDGESSSQENLAIEKCDPAKCRPYDSDDLEEPNDASEDDDDDRVVEGRFPETEDPYNYFN